jgi:hypothetical protein
LRDDPWCTDEAAIKKNYQYHNPKKFIDPCAVCPAADQQARVLVDQAYRQGSHLPRQHLPRHH